MKTGFIKYLSLLIVLFIQVRINYAAVVNPAVVGNTIKIIENKGQWESNVLFKSNIPGGVLFITKTGLAYSMIDERALNEIQHDNKKSGIVKGHNFKVNFLNCNPSPDIVKEIKSSEYYNYFIGNDAGKWANHCYAFQQIVLKNLYDKIDLQIIAQEQSFKINFIVHPGGNPANIRLQYDGINDLNIYNGALHVYTTVGLVKEEEPVCLQGGEKIASSFKLMNNILSYNIASYDKNKELIIDPTVIFGTYSGSFADNWGYTATYDNNGNTYSGGTVYAVGFPVTTGAFQTIYKSGVNAGGPDLARDAGILKYNTDGTQLLFATYLGGTDNEQPHSMICDSSGNLIVMGATKSANFPTTAGAYDRTHNGLYDIYICKFTPDGSSLVGSTFFGGSKDEGINSDSTHEFYDPVSRPLTYNYGDQFRGEVMIDENGSIYVVSTTHSTVGDGFPIKNGFQVNYGGGNQDGCLIKFNSGLTSLVFSTYIGGNNADASYGIGFDNLGNIFVCGGTASSNLVKTGGPQFAYHGDADAYIAKISPSGNALLAFVYLGTTLYDQAYFLQTDKQQNIYVTGQSNGAFPVTTGVYKNTGGKQFIAILDRNLTNIKISTVFGSGGPYPNISPSAFLVDDCNRIYVSGWGGTVNGMFNTQTGSTIGLPVTSNAIQKTTDPSGSDFYLIIFGKDLKSLSYATFFGGAISTEHVDGGTSRFDKHGVVYQSVCGGCRGNSDFPTTPNAWSRINNSSNCNNAVFKIQLNVSEFPPAFRDTLIHINATDLLTLPFNVTDKDGDSIFYSVSGNIFSSSVNAPSVSKNFGAGISSGLLTWQTVCEDVHVDTFELKIDMYDNGCPVVRTGTGSIKIVVTPPPAVASPFPQCLKTIDDNSVKLEWQIIPSSKYFKHYNIYRIKNEGAPQLITTINNRSINSFTDTTASMHIINNYCYFITTQNVCDSVMDSSRTVCSLYRNDTSITPAFSFVKDTIIKVYAFDTLDYNTIISAVDTKDSVYIQCEGTILGNDKLLSFKTRNNIAAATLNFKWKTSCDDISATDTPYLKFYVKDNQCPSPRTNTGIIRIVVIPPPVNLPPDLSCIKYINDNSVEIKWPASVTGKYFSKYVLVRRGPNGTIKSIFEQDKPDYTVVKDDKALNNLKSNYCYALTIRDVCGYYSDTSQYHCTIRQPQDYPPSIPFYTVTVSNNTDVSVFWVRSNAANYQNYSVYKNTLYSKSNFMKLTEAANVSDTFLVDHQVRVHDSSYCYRITQVNECGLESQSSDYACSILLKGKSDPFEHYLKWNGYNYWTMGTDHYDIVRIQPDLAPELIAQNNYTDTVTLDDHLNYENGLYHYKIKAFESVKGRGNTSESNDIELIQPPILHVPNAFTPNADGINDALNIVPVFVKDYHLKIYDRWGKLVFETSDKHEQFKGILEGNQTATGDVYVYVINYTGWDDSSHTRKGNITVLK